MDERLRDAKMCLYALGQAYRNDWSDCDGRTIMVQLEEIGMVIDGKMLVEDFLANNGIVEQKHGFTWED